MRILIAGIVLLISACAGGIASTATPSMEPSLRGSSTPAPYATFRPAPVVMRTPEPTPVPIHHPPPYLIAIEAGHGGPEYWGASARDSDGNLWIEKDLTLAVSKRLQDLLNDAGHRSILVRTEDQTLTPWNSSNYRASMIAETQERVNRANAAGADVLLSVHFNGWGDAGQHGTEAYCNHERTFGEESCQLARFVQQALVGGIRAAGYDVFDRGVKSDAEVNGDPENRHSFVLGTNAGFTPSLMPGTIAEVLFLSNPQDLEFLRRDDAIDVIAAAFVQGLNSYFAWLNGT
jgi:N-acetylmuramoyl-L-alanine amidase